MRMKPWSIISLLLLFSLIFSACAPAASQTERPPLRVEWTIYEADYTMVIAKEKGFFDKYGVNVEPILYLDYYQSYPDIAEHKIDGALFAIGDMLRVNTITPVKAVLVQDSGGAIKIVSTTEIATIADLRGKKIALPVGAGEEMFVREMLYSAGLTMQDVQIVDITVEEVPARLGKDIDAGYVYSPYDQLAVGLGHKVLFTPDSSRALFADVVAFREDVIQDRPEDIRAFINAWFEARQYRLDHPEECNQLIAQATGLSVEEVSGISVTLYNREDNLRMFDRSSTTGTIYDITQTHIDFMNLKGQLTFPVEAHSVYDPSFLEQ